MDYVSDCESTAPHTYRRTNGTKGRCETSQFLGCCGNAKNENPKGRPSLISWSSFLSSVAFRELAASSILDFGLYGSPRGLRYTLRRTVYQ